jgi:hypothetical protein
VQEYENAQEAAEEAATARNFLYGAAGVFTVGFAISIWF